jgi:hypothetical protein
MLLKNIIEKIKAILHIEIKNNNSNKTTNMGIIISGSVNNSEIKNDTK